MAQPKVPHLDDLVGYTMPITVRVLEQMRLPRGLADLPPAQRDFQLANLAYELARTAKYVFLSRRCTDSAVAKRTELFLKFGTGEYADGVRAIASHYRRLNLILAKTADLSKKLFSFYDHCPDNAPGTVIARGPRRTRLRWRYDMYEARWIDPGRTELEALLAEQEKLEFDIASLDLRCKHEEKRLAAGAAFKKEWHEWTWNPEMDWNEDIDVQSIAAPYYLRNGDYNWWVEFTERFRDGVRRSARAPQHIALRDCWVIGSIADLASSVRRSPRRGVDLGQNTAPRAWNDAAADVFAADRGDWNVGAISAAQVNNACNVLRNEDRAMMKWLQSKGRVSNRYTKWLHSLTDEQLQKRWCTVTGTRLSRLRVDFLVAAPKDDEEMRCNELSWCLSRHCHRLYPFKLLGLTHDAEAWRKHLVTWWAPIAAEMPKL